MICLILQVSSVTSDLTDSSDSHPDSHQVRTYVQYNETLKCGLAGQSDTFSLFFFPFQLNHGLFFTSNPSKK